MAELLKQLPPALRVKEELKADILAGRYGNRGDCFITVREVVARTGVSLVTAQKVMTMLQEEKLIERRGRRNILLDYAEAAATASRDSQLIGLLVTNLENPFFAQLTKQVELAARARGLEVITASSNYDPGREKDVLEMFYRKGVAGILACPCGNSASRENFSSCRAPLVFIARKIEEMAVNAVLVENRSAGREVARHLLERGYRNFAYIGVSNSGNDPRREGFAAELKAQGRRLDRKNILLMDNSDLDAALPAITNLLQSLPRPVGIFCFHDLIAARLLKQAYRIGLASPHEIGVVGFDNLPISSALMPPLTTVAYPIDKMATQALDLLMRPDHEKTGGSDLYLTPRLVVRESTGQKSSDPGLTLASECMTYSVI